MKTSNLTASSTEMEANALSGISPPKKKIEVDNPGQFTEGDDDEFDLSLDDGLENLDDIGLDEDEEDY